MCASTTSMALNKYDRNGAEHVRTDSVRRSLQSAVVLRRRGERSTLIVRRPVTTALTTVVYFFVLLLALCSNETTANSNLGTLKTFQAYACDGDSLNVRCPLRTTISVQLAQYGRQVSSELLCPPKTTTDAGSPTLDASVGESSKDNISCLSSDALKVVVAACQEKRQCKVQTSPSTFGADPCPGIRKYAEVAYKCRPHEFISKVTCQKEQLHLKCHKGSRIAIYSAGFGRTLHSNVECPQPDGVPEEDCQASYATEAVMRICHGKRKCTMMADIQTFGNVCAEKSRSYLNVRYTCVPTRVLKNMYQGENDEDYDGTESEGDDELVEEPSYRSPVSPGDDSEVDQSGGGRTGGGSKKMAKDATKKMKTSTASSSSSESSGKPPLPTSVPTADANAYPLASTAKDVQGDDISEEGEVGFGVKRSKGVGSSSSGIGGDDVNCTVIAVTDENAAAASVSVVTEWISAFNFLRGNKEKMILYLVVSVSLGVIAFLVVLVVRLACAKRRERRRAKLNISEPLPNGFCDELSDVDQDITDLSSHHGNDPASSVAMVRYVSSRSVPSSAAGTMRRQDSDTNPRAPITRSHNNFYYS